MIQGNNFKIINVFFPFPFFVQVILRFPLNRKEIRTCCQRNIKRGQIRLLICKIELCNKQTRCMTIVERAIKKEDCPDYFISSIKIPRARRTHLTEHFLTRERKAAKLTAGLWQKGDRTQGKEKKKPFFQFLGRTERAVRKGCVRQMYEPLSTPNLVSERGKGDLEK